MILQLGENSHSAWQEQYLLYHHHQAYHTRKKFCSQKLELVVVRLFKPFKTCRIYELLQKISVSLHELKFSYCIFNSLGFTC